MEQKNNVSDYGYKKCLKDLEEKFIINTKVDCYSSGDADLANEVEPIGDIISLDEWKEKNNKEI
ncbi:hypothetical protein M2140_001777 [Clostridiales Family XIII bacterium PM5-7]